MALSINLPKNHHPSCVASGVYKHGRELLPANSPFAGGTAARREAYACNMGRQAFEALITKVDTSTYKHVHTQACTATP